jgi:hypothetical protein
VQCEVRLIADALLIDLQRTPFMPDTHSNARQGPEHPVLLDAIQSTVQTIEARLKFYRILILAIGVLALGTNCVALVLHRLVVLAGFILIVPLIGGFFYLDSRRVRKWRTRILDMSRSHGLKLRDLCHTTSQMRYLPEGTLKGMLALLPPDPPPADGKTPATEHARHQDQFAAEMRSHERRILIVIALLTLAFAGLTGAFICRSLTLLLSAVGCLVILPLLKRRTRK